MQHFITDFILKHGYEAVFVLMVLESACIPIPSEVVLLFGGAFSTAAVGGDAQLSFWIVCLVALAGNLAGSLLAYWVGRVGGRPLAERWGRRVLIQPHDIDRAHVWFERHGEAAVFFSRMIPVIRAFISLPAGVAEMPLGTFSVYTLAGCLPWTFALAGIGYAVGSQWDTVAKYFKPATYAIAALILIAISWWVLRRLRAQKRDSAPL